MLYIMKQKLWAMGDDFMIKDSNENDVFYVDGKGFSIGDKLSFQDIAGNELAYIAQRMITFRPKYLIYRNGQLFAEVTKEWSMFRTEFSIDVPGPNDYQVQGKFFRHEYSFYRSGRQVAEVSKRYFSFRDTYGIEIIDGEDDITILASAVVIDLICHDGDDD